MNDLCAKPYASGLTVADIKRPSGIPKTAIDFLDRVTYKRMVSEDDLEAVFRLRHDNYKRVGHFEGNEEGKYSDPLDFIAAAHHIGIFVDDKLGGCMRLHVLDKEQRHACAMETFQHVLDPKLDDGLKLVDTSRFCCVPDVDAHSMMLPLAVIRVTGLLAIQRRADYTLATVAAQHANFYKRILGSVDWCEGGVQYPGLTTIVHLLAADVRKIAKMNFENRQYFWSTRSEREALFGNTPSADFVRPTARDVVYEGVDPEYDARP